MILKALKIQNNGGIPHIFSDKDIILLVFPLIVEQLLNMMLGYTDILMIAKLGETFVSAVSLGDSLNILITSLFSALSTGGAVVCAHYFGSRNKEMISLTAKQLIYTALCISAAMMTLGLIFQRFFLTIIFGKIETTVMHGVEVYFFYSLLSYPMIALYSALAALFRAQGNSIVSMFTALIINVLNIGGNAVCIFILKMGVAGVAIPTLFSRGFAAAILLMILSKARLYNGKPAINISGILKIKIDARIIKKILAIGIPNGVENCVFQIGKILVLTILAGFGTTAIAANAAANKISEFACMPGSAIAYAMITVVGQCLGLKRPDEAIYFNRKLLTMTYIAFAAVSLLLVILLDPLLSMFHLGPKTTSLARTMFLFYSVTGVLMWPLSFTLPPALRAANDAKFTMVVSFASMWIVRVGLSYILAKFTTLGALSIWIAMSADWLVRSLLFVTRWKSGVWQKYCNNI
ncbi:MAG: MATE family efflux transporter [Spirochaetaceae bacterium]|jgi:putative MATE family efflux protein|nr:MATE family efflux transporter [Spirochaetaceae bacterium]